MTTLTNQSTRPLAIGTLVDRAMNFPFDRVTARYVRDHDVAPEVAKRLEHECKRMLVLAVIHPDAVYGMTGPVDDYWHVLLLFTRTYQRFCNTLGADFIHHEPGGDDIEQTRDEFRLLANDYEDVYGERPPVDLWVPSDTIDCDCSWKSRSRMRRVAE